MRVNPVAFVPRKLEVGSLSVHTETIEKTFPFSRPGCPVDLLPGSCDFPLDSMEKWSTCASACSAGRCCLDDCADCVSCATYMPCMSLGDPPTAGGGTRTANAGSSTSTASGVTSVEYLEGFNVNYKVTKEEAASLMPDVRFEPRQLKFLEDSGEKEAHYVTLYISRIAGMGPLSDVGRVDVFTYATDPDGFPAMVFLAAIMEVPEAVSDPVIFDLFKRKVESASLDSRTNRTAYPHYYADKFTINETDFEVVIGDTVLRTKQEKKSRLHLSSASPKNALSDLLGGFANRQRQKYSKRNSQQDRAGQDGTLGNIKNFLFSREFLSFNSKVYRSPIDKNLVYLQPRFR